MESALLVPLFVCFSSCFGQKNAENLENTNFASAILGTLSWTSQSNLKQGPKLALPLFHFDPHPI